jgi:hypothetical protein
MAVPLALALPQALSQYISQGVMHWAFNVTVGLRPFCDEICYHPGPNCFSFLEVYDMLWDLIVFLFSMSMTCSNNSIAYLLILYDESLLSKMSLRGWFIRTHIVRTSK